MFPSSLVISALAARMQAVGVNPTMDNLAMIGLHENWSANDEPRFVANWIDVAASSANNLVVYYDVPQAMLGILDNAATGVPNVSYWDNLQWRIEVSGRSIPGFDSIMGPFGLIQLLAPVGYPLMPGQRVAWRVNNLTAGAMTHVTALLRGRIFQAKIPELEEMLRTVAIRERAVAWETR